MAGGCRGFRTQSLVVVTGKNDIVTSYQAASGGIDICIGLKAGSKARTPGVEENKRPK